jgi:hypothetical protein
MMQGRCQEAVNQSRTEQKKAPYIGQNKKGKMTIKDPEYTTQKTKTPNNTSIRHDHQNVYTHSYNGMLKFKINNIKRGRNIYDI